MSVNGDLVQKLEWRLVFVEWEFIFFLTKRKINYDGHGMLHGISGGYSGCDVRAASSPDGSQSHQRAAACVFSELTASPSPPLQPWQHRAWGPAAAALLSWGEELRWVTACLPSVLCTAHWFKRTEAMHWLVFFPHVIFTFMLFYLILYLTINYYNSTVQATSLGTPCWYWVGSPFVFRTTLILEDVLILTHVWYYEAQSMPWKYPPHTTSLSCWYKARLILSSCLWQILIPPSDCHSKSWLIGTGNTFANLGEPVWILVSVSCS